MTPFFIVLLVCILAAILFVFYIYTGRVKDMKNFAPKHWIKDNNSSDHKLTLGANIVTIGGGTGLSTLLSGLKDYTRNITAVVAVTDEGGSSGRLRQEWGMLPPGDIRNCLAALSSDEALLSQVFQYRFHY